jgi:hypothetical protein
LGLLGHAAIGGGVTAPKGPAFARHPYFLRLWGYRLAVWHMPRGVCAGARFCFVIGWHVNHGFEGLPWLSCGIMQGIPPPKLLLAFGALGVNDSSSLFLFFALELLHFEVVLGDPIFGVMGWDIADFSGEFGVGHRCGVVEFPDFHIADLCFDELKVCFLIVVVVGVVEDRTNIAIAGGGAVFWKRPTVMVIDWRVLLGRRSGGWEGDWDPVRRSPRGRAFR